MTDNARDRQIFLLSIIRRNASGTQPGDVPRKRLCVRAVLRHFFYKGNKITNAK